MSPLAKTIRCEDMMTDTTILTPEQLADRYGNRITPKTFANWRTLGKGPVFTKIGGKVFYRLSDVLEWEESRTVREG